MATPGFNEEHYLSQKLSSLTSQGETQSDGTAFTTTAQVKEAIEAAGLTPESHYEQFGFKEVIVADDDSTTRLTPNDNFVAEEYIAAKAAQLVASDSATYPTLDDAQQAFLDALDGGNVYNHYLEFGDTEGLNPSNSFDADQYFQDKLTQLQSDSDSFDSNSTVDDVKDAFADAGLSAIEHFELFGSDEGLSATAVATADEVDPLGALPAPEGEAGETFTLTTGTDDLTGTADDDTFTADLVNEAGVANVQTLTSLDEIDGGAGNDSLTATYDTAVSATISNVESLTLSDRQGVTFDFVNVTDVTDLKITASTAAVDVDNIAAIPTSLDIVNQAQNVNVDFTADAVAGDSDTLTMSVDSMTAGNIVVDTGIETVDITSRGSSANTIADLQTTTGAGTLTLGGTQDLTITATLDAAVTTINAGEATGDITVTQDAADDITVTGGAGADVIDLGADNFDANDTVNGGDGDDKLAIEEDDAIALTTAGNALSSISNIEVIDLVDQLAGDVDLTLFGASAAAAAGTIELSAGIDGTDRTLTVASGNTIDLEADAGDDITITVGGTGTSDSATLILDDADVTANIQATSVETLNITSTGTADGGANVVTGTTAVNTLPGDQSIVITGAEALTFTGVVTADVINGSAMTDVLTVTAGTNAGATVTSGSAADVLDLGDGNADIVDGGAGADTITFDIEVSDNVTGGDGADVFQMDNDTDTSATGAILSDVTAADDIDLDQSTIESLQVDGGAAIEELTDMAGADVGNGDLTTATVSSDNTTLNAGDIVVLQGKTYADSAAALTDIQGAGDRTFTNGGGNYTDNDGVLIAYELTGGGVEIAVVQQNGGASASSDTLDDIDALVTLVGVTNTSVTSLDIDMDG